VISAAIVLLANAKQLLSYYGLQSSDQVIKTSAGNVVSDALRTLDSFDATSNVVTFLIWAAVGAVCFVLVETLGDAYQQFQLERQVGSNKFIHPRNFSQPKFWWGIIIDTISLLFGVTLLAAAVMLFMLILLPYGLAYGRVFLFDFSLVNTLYVILGLAVVTLGLLLIDITVRFLLYRRKLLS
jgi:hypothetical protein